MPSRIRRSHRLITKRSASILAAAAAGASFGSSVFAASGTWTFTSASTSWDNTTAWVSGVVPGSGSLDSAIFNANIVASNGLPNNLNVDMDINVTLGSMSFTDSNTVTPGGWTLTRSGGGSITLDNGSGVPTITVNNLGVAGDTFSPTDIRAYVAIYAPLFSTGTTGGLTKAGVGLLRLGANNSGLFGTLNVNAGTLEIAGTPGSFTALSSLGNLNKTIGLDTGIFSIRSDTAVNMGSYTLNLTSNSGINVDNGVGTTGNNSGNNAGAHTVGTVNLAGTGNRTLTVTGSHNAALNIGVLTNDIASAGAVINNLAPGQLVIGSVISNAVGTAGNTTLQLGGTGTTSIGGDILVNNSVNQGSINLSIIYNDVHTLTVGSFNGVTGGLFMQGSVSRSQQTGGGSITTFAGGGTLNVLAGGLPSGSITLNVGTINVSQPVVSSLTSTTRQLTMGGATISTGTLTPTINLGGGTLLFSGPTANILVNTGTLANPTTTASVQTLATVTGNLDFGSAPVTFTINGTGVPTISTQMVVDGRVNGSGAITKAGRGELILRSANTLSGALTMLGGTFTGIAQASGNALSSGPVTLTSGALGVRNGTAITGSGSVPTLIFSGDSLDSARLVVDATAGGTVSLNIGTFLGRAPGTTGVLTVIPQAGSLGTNEKITVGTIDPSLTPVNGILPVYLASQVSGANTANDFLTRSGTNLITATYVGGNINTAGAAAVFQATGTTTNVLTGAATLYALKSAGQAIGGGFTLTIGNGVQPAGLILNDGASIGTTTILSLNSPEAVIWSGGTLPGTIFSPLTLAGNLTTAGAQTLNLNGLLNLNGNRTITVGSGYAVLNGTLSNGNVVKAGPGTLSLTSSNAGYTGTVTSNAGTVEITGASGDLANGTVVVNAAGYLEFNKGGASFSFNRPILGAGTVVQNSLGGTLVLSAGAPTSSFGNLDIAQGRVLLTATNQLPSTVVLTNSGSAGVFDLNGKTQTIGGLNGVGTVTSSAATTFATLNVNGGGSFGGSIQDGTASAIMTLVKSGTTSTLQLNAVSTFSGGIQVNEGTLVANGGANRLGSSTITLRAAIDQTTATDITNAINVPAGANATISILGTGNEQMDSLLTGSGTLNWVKGNNLLTQIGSWTSFTGTMNFDQAPGQFRMNNTGINNFGAGSAYFNLGNGGANLFTRNGTGPGTPGAFFFGALSGGANTTLSGGSDASAQASTFTVGSYTVGGNPVTTTFGGTLIDNTGIRTVALRKVGIGTLILTGTSGNNGGYTVDGGNLIVAQQGNLNGQTNILINAGTFGFADTGTISGQQNVIFNQGVFDVTGASGGFATPPLMTLQGTGTVSQTGFVRGNYTHGAGTISPGGPLTAGTVNFGNAFNQSIVNLVGGNNLIDILAPGSVGGGFNDLIVTNGTLNITSGTAFRLNQLDDNLPITAGDEYPIIKYNGTFTQSGDPIISAGFRATFALIPHVGTGSGTIAIKITSFIDLPAQNLTWTGALSNDWDLNITTNFLSGSATTFFQLDNVKMDDTAATPTVNLSATTIKPGSWNITNNALTYNIVGLGNIGGTGGLVKNGTGALNLSTLNRFTGGSTLNGGVTNLTRSNVTVALTSGGTLITGGLGAGTVTINNATLQMGSFIISNDVNVPTGSSATLAFNSTGATGSGNFTGNFHGGGTINLIGNGNNNGSGSLLLNSTDNSDASGYINILPDLANFPGASGTFEIRVGSPFAGGNMLWNMPNTPTPKFNLSSQVTDIWATELFFGGLQGNGTITGQGGGSPTNKKAMVIGALGLSTTFAGNSNDNNGTGANATFVIHKVGVGSLTLTGTGLVNSGETIVDAGYLVLDGTANTGGGSLGGNLRNSPLMLVNGGTLLMTNTAQLGRWFVAPVTGDVTAGLTMAANNNGVIDLRQSYNFIGDFVNEFAASRFQLPTGLTVTGNGGTYLGVIQLGFDPNGSTTGYGTLNTTGQGTINPGNTGAGTYGTLKFNELHINAGGTVIFDLTTATTAGGGVNDLIQSSGDLIVSGGTMVVNLNGLTAAQRTYRLMTAGTMSAGDASVDNLIVNGRNAAAHLLTDGTNHWVKLIIDQPSVSNSISWRQQVSNPSFWVANTWDTNLSANWQNGANTADVFYPADAVTFDTTGGGGTVILAAPVLPTSVIVNAGANLGYTFAGTTFIGRINPSAGRISGTTSLIKQGVGSLVLATDNDYTGGTQIQGGTLQIGHDTLGGGTTFQQNSFGSFGSGSVTIASGATLVFARRDAYIVPNAISGGGTVLKVNRSQIRLDGTGTWTGGTVIGNGSVRLGHDNAIPANSLVTITNLPNPFSTAALEGGNLNLFGFNQTLSALVSSSTLNGSVGNGSLGSVNNSALTRSTLTIGTANYGAALAGNLALVKNTTGVATLGDQNSTYTGPTFINAGTLQVITGVGVGSHNGGAQASYIIASGAALAGNGSISAPIVVSSGGIIAPGVFGGPLATQTGTLSLSTISLNSSIMNMDLNIGSLDQILLRDTNGIDTNSFKSIAGTSTFNITNIAAGGAVNAGTYALMKYNGTAFGSLAGFTLGTVTGFSAAYSLALINNAASFEIDLAVVHTGPVANGNWNVDANGSWTLPASWLTNPIAGDVPNTANAIATFGTIITAPRTVSVDAIKTVGTMAFTAPQGYTISGNAGTTITFDTVSTDAGINVTAGSHTITAPIISQKNLDVDVAAGAKLTMTNSLSVASTGTAATGRTVTKTSAGTWQVQQMRNTAGNDGAATLFVNGGRLAVTQVAPGDQSGTSKVNGLSIASGAVVDLANNALIIDYNTGAGIGTLLGDVKAMITSGRLITTTTAPAGRDTRLGFRDNAATTGMGLASVTGFGGLSVDNSSVLVKYTYGGDTNLDGIVDIKDLYNLALHYNAPGNWVDGDANYDGTVNVADLTILARNWQANASLGGGSSLSAALTSLGLPDVAVPEPTSIGLVGLGLAGLMSRRRRRSN